MTLPEAMVRALEANTDLQASQVDIDIADEDTGIARSSLLPQLNASTSYQTIDKDRANPQGLFENSTDASISASQTIYSDDQWAAFKIAKHLRNSTSLETKITMLDTLQSSATAYLNVLRTIALEQVQKSNVELTRDNLELAKSRVQIGESSRADELRWKSQIARDRQSLLSAEADRLVAESELYRVLQLIPSEPIATSDESIQQVLNELNREENRSLYDNPLAWEKFIEFQSSIAIENAPEVQRFDYLLKAQNRQITADKRAYYVPDVALTSSLTENLDRSGAGSDLSGTGIHDDQWSIGVQATLPIFTSGQLKSQLSRSRYQYQQLTLQQRSQKERVETRMRSALYNAAASHTSIRLAMDAASAANENLDLVTDSYSEGAVSVTDLIDAQDAALAAKLQAAAARYQFLIDLVEVLRAESNFDLLLQQDGVKIWQQRIKQTMQ
jgi:outer membrane protein TolC